MDYDPLGLNVFGVDISSGGYAAGVSASGIALTDTSSSSSAALSTTSIRLIDPIQRRKLQGELIDYLKDNRGSHSFDSLAHGQWQLDLRAPEASKLLEDLRRNNRVSLEVEEGYIAYKPEYPSISNKKDIISLLDNSEFGVLEQSLLDAYKGIERDIEDMIEEGEIYRILNEEKKKDNSFLFKRHTQYELHIPSEIKGIWSEHRLPSSTIEIEEVLIKSGHLTEKQLQMALLEQARRNAEDTNRKKREAELRKLIPKKKYKQHLTNIHLQSQFSWINTNNIMAKK